MIRREDGCILLARRLPGGPHVGLWEFPGGKVEEGELETTALVREIREELGAGVSVGDEIGRVEHEYPHVTIRLAAYYCRIRTGTPRPLQCAEVSWAAPAEILTYPMPEADLPIARKIQEP